ncbi:MAG: hypothetical protein ACRDZ8_07660 [Acidimicrobiales bacterium]
MTRRESQIDSAMTAVNVLGRARGTWSRVRVAFRSESVAVVDDA